MNKKQLKEKYGDEKVFIVPYQEIEFIPDGFTKIREKEYVWNMFDRIGHYVYRYDAEGEPSMQQIIPYILILDKDGEKIFTTHRIAGDSRLVNKLSIACGGHIDESDGMTEPLFKAAVRELFEEVDIWTNRPITPIGFIRDMASSTNDHTGVVMIVYAESYVEVKEKDNLIGEWMTLTDLINNYTKLEGWSKYITDYFAEKGKMA